MQKGLLATVTTLIALFVFTPVYAFDTEFISQTNNVERSTCFGGGTQLADQTFSGIQGDVAQITAQILNASGFTRTPEITVKCYNSLASANYGGAQECGTYTTTAAAMSYTAAVVPSTVTFGIAFSATYAQYFRFFLDAQGQAGTGGLRAYGSTGDMYSGGSNMDGHGICISANNESADATIPVQDLAFSVVGSTTVPFDAITVTPPINWQAYTAVATGSNLFSVSTSSLSYISQQCDNSGNIFSQGLCYAGTFLFVPNPEILNSYAALPALMETRFPFSWVTAVKNIVTGLSATGAASPTYTIGLHDLGLGSTTPIGNIMPNVVALSTTTVRTYISDTVWNAMQTFFAAGLWVFLGFDIYATIRRRHAHV